MVSIGRRPDVAAAAMRPLVIVVGEPGVEPGLEVVEAVEGRLAQSGAEELVEHGPVEAFDEAGSVHAHAATRGRHAA